MYKKFLLGIFLLAIFFLPIFRVNAAVCTSTGSGNWSNTAIWSCGHAPVAPTDSAVVANGHAITVDGADSATALTINNGNANSSVTIASPNSLAITNAVTITGNTNLITKQVAVGSGTLSAGSISINSGNGTKVAQVTVSTGTITLTGGISFTGTAGNAKFTFTGSGLLNIGGNMGTGGTFTASTGTVNFNIAGAQTINSYTYNNLTFSGSGAKTTTGATINGILSMQGTATTTGTVATYGAASTLEYKGTGAQTTGTEFTTPWPGSGGVKINNNNSTGVTLGAAKSLGTNPLTIGDTVSNSIFKDGGFQLTATGTLNLTSGTFNLGNGATATTYPAFTTNNISSGTTVNYNSTATQTISAVNYANLFNTANGNRTLASSGTIGVSGTFTPSTGTNTVTGSTVSFNGTTGSQNISAFTFNNLTINNSSGVSLTGNTTVNSTLTFTSGKITTGVNFAILGSAAFVSGAGAGKYINGNLRRNIPATLNLSEPFNIGDASNYTPVTILFAGTPAGASTIDTSTTVAQPPIASTISQTKYVNRKWTLTNNGVTGFTSFSPTFTFINPGDLVGSPNTAVLIVRKADGTAPSSSSSTSTTATGTGFTSFSDFYIGEQGDITPPTFTTQYYSDSGLFTSMGNNPILKAGTYYIKITASEVLSGTPTISINAEGNNNDITNAATTLVSGNDYKYTRTILSDAAAVGNVLEIQTITGTDLASNTATNIAPTNAATSEAYTDTTAPSAPNTPDMTDATDTGSSNTDNITSNATPSFTISCETGDTVTLYDNVTSVGTGVCASSTVTIASSVLSSGAHTSMNAKQTDTAGNVSVASSNLSITIDTSVPTLSSVNIASNNSNNTFAKTGDIVTLTFTSNESVQTPTVTISGASATVTGGPTSWSASRTMLITDTEGTISFNISFSDIAGNAGTAVTATTDSSSVSFDRTAPNSATSLSWSETSPHNTVNINATWTKSNSGDLANQKIQFYSDSICSVTSGSLIDLASTSIQTEAFMGIDGNTYTYKITSIDTLDNENISDCSPSMTINIPIPDTTPPTNFTVGTVITTGGTVVSDKWNSTNTGVNITIPIDNDSTLTDGNIQLQASTNGTYENIGSLYTILISDLNTNKTLSITDTQLEAITGFSENATVTFTAIITDVANNSNTGFTSAISFLVDQIIPTVTVNQALSQNDPINTSPINFTAQFSEAILGFNNSDITLSGSAGATTSVVTNLGGNTYNIEVSGMTGVGSVSASIDLNKVTDLAGNPNDTSTSTDNTVFFDNIAPNILSINRSGSNPTNATSVDFTVTFSKPVSSISTDSFTLNTTGVSGPSITSVSASSGSSVTVTVNTGTDNGTIRLDILGTATIKDSAGNSLSNTPFTTGQTYDINKSALTANIIAPSLTNISTIPVSITLSSNSTDFDATDIDLGGNGTVSNFTGNDSNYSFDITSPIEGLITITIPAGAAHDNLTNPNLLTSLPITYDHTSPIISKTIPVPTPSNNINPSVTFNSNENGNITYGGSCGSGSLSNALFGTNITSFNSLPNSTYSDCTITVTDTTGNPSLALAITTFEIDTNLPVTKFVLNNQISMTTGTTIVYTVERKNTSDSLVESGLNTIYLYANSTTTSNRQFRDINTNNPITSLTIPDGSSLKQFKYFDDCVTGCSVTITASDSTPTADGVTGIQDGTDDITVNTIPAIADHFTIDADNLNPNTNQITTLTIQAKDSSGQVDTLFDNFIKIITSGSSLPGATGFIAHIQSGQATINITDNVAEIISVTLMDSNNTGLILPNPLNINFTTITFTGGGSGITSPIVTTATTSNVLVSGNVASATGGSISLYGVDIVNQNTNLIPIGLEIKPDPDGLFIIDKENISATFPAYGIQYTDPTGNKAPFILYTKGIDGNINVKSVNISPTAQIVADNFAVYTYIRGYSSNLGAVTLYIDGTNTKTAQVKKDGSYEIQISANNLSLGQHSFVIKDSKNNSSLEQNFQIVKTKISKADLNKDGQVSISDLSAFTAVYAYVKQGGKLSNSLLKKFDFNNNGKVGAEDLSIILQAIKK